MPLRKRFTFLKESRKNFRTTGAVLPSSRYLARRIAARAVEASAEGTVRVLEVGAGTGVFSGYLAEQLGSDDTLDLCEINPAFAQCLRQRFGEPGADGSPEVHVIEDSVLNLDPPAPYDFIISGLPFNSFEADFVEAILDKFTEILKPEGVLSFFEYWLIREFTRPFGSRQYRERVRGVERVVVKYVEQFEVNREMVFLNVPPAVVRHLSLNGH